MTVASAKPKAGSILGLAIDSLAGNNVIHGLRHEESGNSNGWFIWAGEYSDAENFFSPICVDHIEKYLDPAILRYLDLPPGYRFMYEPDKYEDIWFDKGLLIM